MLEKIEGAIKNGQFRETGNIWYTRQRQKEKKKNHSTICVGHYCTQTNTNNVNKTWALLLTTGGKDEPNIICMRKSYNTPIVLLVNINVSK